MNRVGLIALIIVSVLLLVFTNFGEDRIVRYDCSVAHWHPDVPAEVKKQCQEMLNQQRIEKEKRLMI
jgi:hypothetical protein